MNHIVNILWLVGDEIKRLVIEHWGVDESNLLRTKELSVVATLLIRD